jgi:hypothetical protein
VSSHTRTWPALDIAGLPPADAPDAHDAVQGDLLEAALTDFDVEAIDESAPAGWRVFFRTHAGRDRAQQAIARQFPALGLTPVDVPDEDWAARLASRLKAVRVGNLIVAPPGMRRSSWAIRPSMGFGTDTTHHRVSRRARRSRSRSARSSTAPAPACWRLPPACSAPSTSRHRRRRGRDSRGVGQPGAEPAAIVTLLVGDLRRPSSNRPLSCSAPDWRLLMASASVIKALAGGTAN